MLVKDRGKSIRIRKLEVMQRRVIKLHPKYLTMEDELSGRLAGHFGEQSNDYFLKPFRDFSVMHDLRLTAHESYFQIDTLLLSPRYLLNLEVKYITGTLVFDHLNQVIRVKDDGSEEAFRNPIFQVKRQQSHLIEWMIKNRIPPIPVRSLVVMSNPRTIIKAPPSNKDVLHYITHSPYLQEKIKMIDKMYTDEKLTIKEVTKLSKLIVRHHCPENPDLLKRYGIEEKDIIKGVYCTECFYLPVVRQYGKWHCSRCNFQSEDLHLATLEDFALLFGPTITNKQFCDFLQVPSRHVAKRILRTLDLSYTGTYKNRKYLLPFLL
ncbi:nuclease-related domain-containing protein [Fictibacillus sp. 26RED30]|uniref:nuclease-related domain-containing protein n=1 Tax=Fictibacillus sp. 26RED30 TaxID=2745877 RepID=UPI0018CD74A0|nr:nuclease-related domain-containing protein [Fictibacillus sp. 26RED30]MBH0163252.1 NERD domain-containing protein [Fictibacillus sp. 26RED30]